MFTFHHLWVFQDGLHSYQHLLYLFKVFIPCPSWPLLTPVVCLTFQLTPLNCEPMELLSLSALRSVARAIIKPTPTAQKDIRILFLCPASCSFPQIKRRSLCMWLKSCWDKKARGERWILILINRKKCQLSALFWLIQLKSRWSKYYFQGQVRSMCS